jgi:uncharacterized membrane protein YgcG
MIRFFGFIFALLFVFKGFCSIHVQDDKNLLSKENREAIELMAARLKEDTGVCFLFKSEENNALSRFDRTSKDVFSQWIRTVPMNKGFLLYIQMEKDSKEGRAAIFFGHGLRGSSIVKNEMQKILNEKIIPSCSDPKLQNKFLDGIGALLKTIEPHYKKGKQKEPDEPVQSFDWSGVKRGAAIAVIALIAGVLFVYFALIRRSRICPKCGAKLHSNVRRAFRGEGKYSRIKIIKCLECNFYKKYLY